MHSFAQLYENEILQENMRSIAFFKDYKICILLHRCNLKIFAKNRFEKSAISVKIQQKFANVAKLAKSCQNSKISAWESGRFWKIVQNAYFLAKIGADTAENEQHFAEISPKLASILRGGGTTRTDGSSSGSSRRQAWAQNKESKRCRNMKYCKRSVYRRSSTSSKLSTTFKMVL